MANNYLIKIGLPCGLDVLVATIQALEQKYGSGLMIVQDESPDFITIERMQPMPGFAKNGCRPLGLDEIIEAGDWVADVDGESMALGVPCVWVEANGTIGSTSRQSSMYACRPLALGNSSAKQAD